MSQWPARVARITVETTDSALDEVSRWPLTTRDSPAWVLALRQTAPRGRRGRVWHQPLGNFAAAVVEPRPGGPDLSVKLSFVSALAVHMAIEELTGSATGLALKWPNDVLLNDKKVAGILLESMSPGQAVAIGFGVNLVAAPNADEVEPGAVQPGSILGETGIEITPGQFLDVLGPTYHRFADIYRTYGFEHIRERWLARAARLNEIVTVRLPREEIVGRFVGLDALGQMQLQTPAGMRAISAGDVYF